MKPLISIVIPTNHADLLEQAIVSIISETGLIQTVNYAFLIILKEIKLLIFSI